MLAIFYFAIPVGTGLGYIVGSEVAGAFGDWRWGLRVTPIMGAIAVLGIVFGMTDPPRGQADGSHLKPSSPVSDVKALAKNRKASLFRYKNFKTNILIRDCSDRFESLPNTVSKWNTL